MAEIPEVYGIWESPCCGDPGDCNEPCAQAFAEAGHPFPAAAAAFARTAGTVQPIARDALPFWRYAPMKLLTRDEIESRYGPPVTP